MAGVIVTVTGEIRPEQLGPALCHEHLHCDVSIVSGRADNRLIAPQLMPQEMARFAAAGGRAIVEVTPEGIGRDAASLAEISRASGVTIVSGIAFYVQETYPAWVASAAADKIADYFVMHLDRGVGGVRAGLIGEVASHNETAPNARGYRLEPLERRVFEAAALAQQQTGACISTHASLGRAGHAQLDVLEAAGADLSKVVIGHCDAHWHADAVLDFEYYLPILERGAYCQFDLVGWEELGPDEIRAERIAELVERGHQSQILLGTDTCRLSQLHANGGRGYDFVWTSFLRRLRCAGVSAAAIEAMLVDNPRRVLERPRRGDAA